MNLFQVNYQKAAIPYLCEYLKNDFLSPNFTFCFVNEFDGELKSMHGKLHKPHLCSLLKFLVFFWISGEFPPIKNGFTYLNLVTIKSIMRTSHIYYYSHLTWENESEV